MIPRVLKFTALVIAGFLLIAIPSALAYRNHVQHRVAEEIAIRSPNGIDSLEAVRIGGIDQWIEVRGQRVDNPILLVLHGGPGVAFIPLARSFQSQWENRFTVVEWDQRGAGKTFASNDASLQRNTMTLPQMEQDSLDVVNYLRHRFRRKKIFVLGHSWGSVLGLWLAHEHPELIDAYVGVGQIIDVHQNDERAFSDALQAARETHNVQAVRELESIAPYPAEDSDLRSGLIARRWESRLLSPHRTGAAFESPFRILSDVLSAPQYSLMDDIAFVRGQRLSLSILAPQIASIDLRRLGLAFREPVFFFEGRHDPYCRPSLIWDYSQSIEAPQKEFVWFENSGHFPFYEEQQKFADELVDRVLPVASQH
jgi:pimeloyl-ACP methyl ester carboxylesterase